MSLVLDAPRAAPRLFATLAAVHLALLATILVWGVAETRTLGDAPVWLKPAKFALSLAVTFATLALVQARLSDAVAEGRLLRVTAAVMAVCALGEMAYITLQAARGEASHFNDSDSLHAAAYAVMGVGAVLLTLGIGAVGWATLRDPAPLLATPLRVAIGWSFLATVPLVLLTAGSLGGSAGHFVGTPPPGAPTVPLLGWSLAVGDLRAAHFLALHAMQAVPLWAMGRVALGGRPGRAEVALVLGLWTALTLWQFARALSGLPPA